MELQSNFIHKVNLKYILSKNYLKLTNHKYLIVVTVRHSVLEIVKAAMKITKKKNLNF